MKFGIREIIFIAVMLGLLACSYFLVLTKAQQKVQAQERKIEEKQKALADLERATAGVSDIDRKVEELQEAIKFFEKKLPQEREMDLILKEVWQMAEQNKLATKTIRTMKSVRGAAYSEQPIEMNLSGDFAGFYEFMLQLERLPRLTRVQNMTLDKINGQEGLMEAKVTLSIFFEPETGSNYSASAR
jgi:type IV pilus assembly protein PilO